jgi:hypothetical protein
MEADVSKHTETGDGFVGRGLPGTGGDVTPTDLDHDVEGHRYTSDDPDAPGPESLHTGTGSDAPTPDGLRAIPDEADGKDVEGHLFHTGPTTEGEFSRRGPGENPHGDR